ncbi:hypothetical protein CVO77_03605 [Sphingopyxis lindanitolerans]|uniref:Uncharacterized protein n=1 Tax=Sphingopyxis lindanitolerans TaxID=2054227 RepID=A0A2S8B5Y9_9SPHN|nr:hypothetical protein [Sphingopyxis lindanitolerans]PQM27669.1 hypothetical protein CVO77_03605 [Sphingopyxis lindanitolerans]
MQHDPFDPAAWLARWHAVGGAWAGGYLIRPPGHDRIGADLLTAELDDDRRQAVRDHIGWGETASF